MRHIFTLEPDLPAVGSSSRMINRQGGLAAPDHRTIPEGFALVQVARPPRAPIYLLENDAPGERIMLTTSLTCAIVSATGHLSRRSMPPCGLPATLRVGGTPADTFVVRRWWAAG